MLSGTISVVGSAGGPLPSLYVGREVLLKRSEVFDEIRTRPEWPVRDVISGGKEKGEPHAAAVFLARPRNGTGTLRVSDAVFLPVGHSAALPMPTVQWDIDLVLHGYSFVNSNRTAIERDASPNDVARTVRADWNGALRSRAVLPSILPALARFVQIAGLTYSEVAPLTRALAGHFRKEQEHVCRSHQWLPCYAADGGTAYRLLVKHDSYAELPRPSSHERLPWLVFPALANVADERNVAVETDARFVAAGPRPWQEAELAALLRSVPVSETFADATRLRYLEDVLRANQPVIRDSILLQKLVVDLVKIALRDVGLGSIPPDQLDAILALLPAECVHVLAAGRTSDEDMGATVAWLATLGTQTVVIARRSAPSDPAAAVSVRDGRLLLSALREPPAALASTAALRNLRTQLACGLLGGRSTHAEELRREFAEVPLFPAWVSGVGDTVVALTEIEEAEWRSSLVARAVNASVEPASALAMAVPDLRLLVLTEDVASEVAGNIASCISTPVCGC